MRYYKYNYLIKNFILSKTLLYDQKKCPSLLKIRLELGHFKFNNLFVEHGLIFLNLTGQKFNVILFKHGKRLRRTLLLASSFNGQSIWYILDKLINLLLPLIDNLQTVKFHKILKKNNQYFWKIRKFFEFEDINYFWTDRLLRKKIFFPLTLNLTCKKNKNHKYNEHLFRMLRLPFIFYKKYKPKALDDILRLKIKKSTLI